MKLPTISSYGKYSNDNYGRNTLQVKFGPLTLYYSYSTIVGFKTPKVGLVISKNCWGTTTGKHLNWLESQTYWIDHKKSNQRLSRGEFEDKLKQVLKKYNLLEE